MPASAGRIPVDAGYRRHRRAGDCITARCYSAAASSAPVTARRSVSAASTAARIAASAGSSALSSMTSQVTDGCPGARRAITRAPARPFRSTRWSTSRAQVTRSLATAGRSQGQASPSSVCAATAGARPVIAAGRPSGLGPPVPTRAAPRSARAGGTAPGPSLPPGLPRRSGRRPAAAHRAGGAHVPAPRHERQDGGGGLAARRSAIGQRDLLPAACAVLQAPALRPCEPCPGQRGKSSG